MILSAGVRTFLLWIALLFPLGLVALLFKLGHLDPAGPLGPLGIGASFLCSLVALIAIIGLAGGSGSVRMIDGEAPAQDRASGSQRAQAVFGTISNFASLFTWGLSALFILVVFHFTHSLSLVHLFLCLGLIFLVGCSSLATAIVALIRREPRLWVPCLGALISLPLVVYSGYALVFLLMTRR